MKKIVISAVNITEAGPLSILKDLLSSISEICTTQSDIKVVALVHEKKNCYFPNIKYIEIKSSKSSWVNRIYYEYLVFRKISKVLKPFLWISLHDTTPSVISNKQVVYCHNPSPFYKIKFNDIRFDLKFVLFAMFYKYLYQINIKNNDSIIVQQSWIRDSFAKTYSIPKDKIIVSVPIRKKQNYLHNSLYQKTQKLFFYPAMARTFKNFEVICKSVLILNKKGISDFTVVFTINGKENKYSRWVYGKYKHIPNIKFIGKISSEEVFKYYMKCSCLLFPSRLETWGLPISEFSAFDKPMIISDMKYAHETSSGSKQVAFFNPNSSKELADLMEDVINEDMSCFSSCDEMKTEKPYVQSWEDLIEVLLN